MSSSVQFSLTHADKVLTFEEVELVESFLVYMNIK